jgi:hypothetical protein
MGLTAGMNGRGNLDPTGIRSPDRPARSESLCPLRYPGRSFNGYWGNFPRVVKLPWSEIDHLRPCSSEVKNEWSYTSAPPYTFMA